MKDYEQHSNGAEGERRPDEHDFKLRQPPEPIEPMAEPRTERMLTYFRWRKQFVTASVLRVIVCCFLLSGVAAKAQDTFQLLKTYTPVPDCPPAKSLTLVTDDHQVTFIPPENSVVKPYYEKRELWITYPDDRCLLKLLVSTNNAELVRSGYTNELRKLLEQRYPAAEVAPAAVCHTGCSLGYSFDIQQYTAYKTKIITRLAFVPVPAGMLELSVTSSEAKFGLQQFALARLLSSLHAERPNPATLSVRKS